MVNQPLVVLLGSPSKGGHSVSNLATFLCEYFRIVYVPFIMFWHINIKYACVFFKIVGLCKTIINISAA